MSAWVKSGHSLAMECLLVGTLAVVMARLNLIVIAVRQRRPGASLRTASKGPLIQAFAIDFQRLSCSAINSARRRSSFPSRMPMSSGSARQ